MDITLSSAEQLADISYRQLQWPLIQLSGLTLSPLAFRSEKPAH